MRNQEILPYLFVPPSCAEYDPRTVEVAKRVAQLITACVPSVTVEHVGSTAVPGCAGKGVVDLLIVYPDGQLDAVKQTLAELGFQPQTHGFLFPETRPMRVGALEHKGDVFRLHVHVLAESSPEVAQMCAFRDRLRVDRPLRRDYVAHKRRIVAKGVHDPAAYTRMKSTFIQEVLAARARASC
jgi:GrpB-like predicted nucleotidyltransferase (UPF0157 family)